MYNLCTFLCVHITALSQIGFKGPVKAENKSTLNIAKIIMYVLERCGVFHFLRRGRTCHQMDNQFRLNYGVTWASLVVIDIFAPTATRYNAPC